MMHTCTLYTHTRWGVSAKILMKMAMVKSHLKSSLYATTQPWLSLSSLAQPHNVCVMHYAPFQHLNHAYPTVLYPAFRIQVLFQNLILDPEEWDQISRQREAVTEWQVTDRCHRLLHTCANRGYPLTNAESAPWRPTTALTEGDEPTHWVGG